MPEQRTGSGTPQQNWGLLWITLDRPSNDRRWQYRARRHARPASAKFETIAILGQTTKLNYDS
jgi:hypothetical protein